MKIKWSCDKLNYKKLRPFEIDKKIGALNYKLKLPKIIHIHPIFHVSLLKKAPQNAKRQRVEVEDNTEYEVERIVDHDQIDRKTHYLVKIERLPTIIEHLGT